MSLPTESYKQYGQQPFYYVNSLQISNDATTPNTKLDVSTGTCLDSTGTYQLTLSSAVVINAASTGLNGIDTGTFAASTLYRVFVVADPISANVTGCLISASDTPTLPFGYSAYKLIGYAATDASAHFLKGYWTTGNGPRRVFMYDAPQATAVTAGASTTYAAVDLTGLVPPVENTPVWIATAFTPAAAGHALSMQPFGATGDAITINGQVVSVVVDTNSYLLAKLSSTSPKISYKVANGSDAVAINVAGYEFEI